MRVQRWAGLRACPARAAKRSTAANAHSPTHPPSRRLAVRPDRLLGPRAVCPLHLLLPHRLRCRGPCAGCFAVAHGSVMGLGGLCNACLADSDSWVGRASAPAAAPASSAVHPVPPQLQRPTCCGAAPTGRSLTAPSRTTRPLPGSSGSAPCCPAAAMRLPRVPRRPTRARRRSIECSRASRGAVGGCLLCPRWLHARPVARSRLLSLLAIPLPPALL